MHKVNVQIAQHFIDRVRIRNVRRALLKWFETNRREFFWREPGVTPFAILITEMLLTKTRAELAAPIAAEVVARFPSASSLAKANEETLSKMLYPLGLHRKRAHHLVRCANELLARHDGMVPSSVGDLLNLPYVGRYTANAVVCVAFDQPVPVLDANVARIYRRVFSLSAPPVRLSVAHEWWDLAGDVLSKIHPKEYNWALLDLGGTICTANGPVCVRCPIACHCDTAHGSTRPQRSLKQIKAVRPVSRAPKARSRPRLSI